MLMLLKVDLSRPLATFEVDDNAITATHHVVEVCRGGRGRLGES